MKTNLIYIIVVAAAVILGGIWAYYYFKSAEETPAVTISSALAEGVSIAQADDPFFLLLEGLNKISIDNLSLLSDPIFRSALRDFSVPPSDRGQGRKNPFASFGVGNLSKAELGRFFGNASSTIMEASASSTDDTATEGASTTDELIFEE